LYKLFVQEFDVQDIKVLPKVKGLTVCIDNFEHPTIWKRFQTVSEFGVDSFGTKVVCRISNV